MITRPHGIPVFLLTVCLSTFAAAQRNLSKDAIPDPDPEIERKSFIVADGFEVNLFAGDPQIAKPIQMNFDADGRLWIASSEVYPHIKPGQKATDKILVVEDTDHDGTADKTTVFADGLLIPTGVVPDVDGAYVANSTDLIHFRDTDGDGRADDQRVVLSGFGTEDTHHLLHTLRWGPDGCLYMNQSIYIHSHVETPHGVVRLGGGGIWRFRPETERLQILCRGFVNPWGHHFDHWGQSFATDGAYGEGINYVFPGAVYVTAPGAKRRLRGLNPGSPKHCGLEIASGRHLPDDWAGNMLTNDFRAHRVCRFVVSEDGAGYASRQEAELIKTRHVAFRPIDVKMGPDGAIYIADWYNPIIQHGEVDFRDPRRDHVHGRIWRVTAKGRPTLKPANLRRKSNGELLESLKSPESWIRLHAKLLLKSRGAAEVVGELTHWLSGLDPRDKNAEHDRLEGLWLSQNLGIENNELLRSLLASGDHRVRAAAMRVAGDWQQHDAAFAGVADEHPRVRLEAVRLLSQVNTKEAASAALRVLDQPMDRFLDFALWQTLRDLESSWLPALREGQFDYGGNTGHLEFALKAVDSPDVVSPLLRLIEQEKIDKQRIGDVLVLAASLGNPAELSRVLETTLSESVQSADKARVLGALADASQSRRVRPAGDLARIGSLIDSEDTALAAAVVRAAGVWKLAGMRGQLERFAQDADASTIRHAAIEGLALLGGPESARLLKHLATDAAASGDRIQALSHLVGINAAEASRLAVEMLADLPADVQADDLISPLLVHKNGATALTKAFDQATIPADAARLALRAVESAASRSPELVKAVRKAGNLENSGWKLTAELRAELVAEVARQGDAERGQLVYRRAKLQCMKCHAIGGAGGRVGPDLLSVGASAQPDYLLDSLIDPNAKVKENFHSKSILTDEGRVFAGIVVRRSNQELVLRDADDRLITIPVDSIELERDGRSLMPNGLVDELTRVELVDLVRFLSELGKVGKFAVGKEPIVRRWRTLVWTREGHRRLNRTSYDTAASNDPALVWQPAYSLVSGDLPVDDLGEFVTHRGLDPTSFLDCEVEVTTAGRVRFGINSVSGLLLWIDGKPTPPSTQVTVDLERGRHKLTIAVNRKQRTEPLRVELLNVPDSAAQAAIVGGK